MKRFAFSLASLLVLLMIGLCVPVEAQQVSLGVPADPDGAGTLAAGDIPSGGFVVFGRAATAAAAGIMGDVVYTQLPAAGGDFAAMPDLETFFSSGGTVDLVAAFVDPADGAADTGADADADTNNVQALVSKSLVISEIMWGLDVDPAEATFGLTNSKQWIEVYNTTDKTIEVENGELYLVFNAHRASSGAKVAASHIVCDTVSNVGVGGKWTMPGSSGVTQLIDRRNAPSQSNIVSAYRNIDYKKVRGIHKLTAANEPVPGTGKGSNREAQLADFQATKGADGTLAGGWKATQVAGSRNMMRWYIGSPGAQHAVDTDFTFAISKTSIPSNSVVINEIRNSGKAGEDWVELYNAGTTAVGLRDWELSIIKAGAKPEAGILKTDVRLVGKDKDDDDSKRFPPNDEFKLKPGEYLLIVERHPSETSLANGVNVEEVVAGSNVNAGATHQYIVRESLDLNGVGMLLLRSALDKNNYHNKDDSGRNYMTSKAPSEKIMDYAGAGFIAVKSSTYNTEVWPFRGWTKPGDTEGIPSGKAFARKRYNADDGHHKDAWDNVGHKGGIGYDPGVDLRDAPGTPGYANNALMTQLVDDKDTSATSDDVAFMGAISISEVMVDAGPRWNLVQWIELYNSSMTEAINLKDWELEIRNATDEVESYVDSGFDFNDAYILPNQTLLLVSGQAVNDVADNRVYNLHQHHRRQLGLTNRRSVLLSPGGFYLKLTDKNGDMVDEAGNVMVDGAARKVQWELPARSPDMRRSLVRQYGSRELYDGQPDKADDGTMMESWRQSDIAGAGISFYGHRDDVSTPGYRLGGPLPVTLSKFRPVRNQTTGHVDITWITQSELNNAGFNILRAESKSGDFKVINVKGIIAGHGTTSEKHVYTFTDTTAKPNIVYYYQIEDVSINGLRTTLTTTHLRGHVGAAGKLTTTWGDLKHIQ